MLRKVIQSGKWQTVAACVSDRHILLIALGEKGADTCSHLHSSRFLEIVLSVSRSA